MSDCRNSFIKSIEMSLASILDPEVIEVVSRKLFVITEDYEIKKRTTDITPYDNGNDKIINQYCACMSVDGKSKKTIYAYKTALRRLAEFIGKPLKEIGTYEIRYYLACEKERGVSNVSIENTRSYISVFYKWMVDEEIIGKNPCSIIKPIKFPHKEKFPFSSIEMDALRHACKNEKERAIIEMLASSGIRVSELSDIDVTDIDFQDKVVHVKCGKGGKGRITYISDVAKLHVQKYLMSRNDEKLFLFCNKNHERLNTGGIRHLLRQIGSRANVDNVHPHRFRRTFATTMANRGMAIQEIQKLLGHSNIATTMTYVCVDNEKTRASYRQHIA